MIKLTNDEIKKAIEAYTAILKDSDALIKFFDGHFCFYYEKQHYNVPSAKIHAYPALHNETPLFLVIPAHYDNADKADVIHEYVVGCVLTPEPLKGNRIPDEEAMARIDLWRVGYDKWIPQQVAGDVGMFQVAEISAIDFETENSQLYMALKPDAEREFALDADMIVMSEGKKTHYDDYTKFIPPYPHSAAATSFYLLNL